MFFEFDFRSTELAIFHFSYGTGEILPNILNVFFAFCADITTFHLE